MLLHKSNMRADPGTECGEPIFTWKASRLSFDSSSFDLICGHRTIFRKETHAHPLQSLCLCFAPLLVLRFPCELPLRTNPMLEEVNKPIEFHARWAAVWRHFILPDPLNELNSDELTWFSCCACVGCVFCTLTLSRALLICLAAHWWHEQKQCQCRTQCCS